MSVFKMFGRKKRRKYPIKLTEEGLTARRQRFDLFEKKVPLNEIVDKVGVKIETVRKYHQQWKKNPGLQKQIAFIRELFKKTAPDRDRNIELFARTCGITKEQYETILSQPHGLRWIMTGKFYFPAHADADRKRQMALELGCAISDHLVEDGGKYEDVDSAFRRWMKEYQIYREEEDADIKDENRDLELVHRALAAAAKQEREGRVKPDTLSEEGRNAVMRYGIESEKKKTEIEYWLRIGKLNAGGLTVEQAREKIYQDVISKGDLKLAKLMREFQDKIHPLKTKDQSPPPSPLPPPPPT